MPPVESNDNYEPKAGDGNDNQAKPVTSKHTVEIFDCNGNRRCTLQGNNKGDLEKAAIAEVAKQDTYRPAMAPHRAGEQTEDADE